MDRKVGMEEVFGSLEAECLERDRGHGLQTAADKKTAILNSTYQGLKHLGECWFI